MNTILRSSIRSIRSLTNLSGMTKTVQNRMFHVLNRQSFASNTAVQLTNPSINCKCGCAGMSKIHTKGKKKTYSNICVWGYNRCEFHNHFWFISGEKELVEFLAEEIVAERKAQKVKTIPSDIDGFKVKLDGADVEFHKDLESEK